MTTRHMDTTSWLKHLKEKEKKNPTQKTAHQKPREFFLCSHPCLLGSSCTVLGTINNSAITLIGCIFVDTGGEALEVGGGGFQLQFNTLPLCHPSKSYFQPPCLVFLDGGSCGLTGPFLNKIWWPQSDSCLICWLFLDSFIDPLGLEVTSLYGRTWEMGSWQPSMELNSLWRQGVWWTYCQAYCLDQMRTGLTFVWIPKPILDSFNGLAHPMEPLEFHSLGTDRILVTSSTLPLSVGKNWRVQLENQLCWLGRLPREGWRASGAGGRDCALVELKVAEA